MTDQQDPLTWATSEGGPLILLDRQHLTAWEGTETPSAGRIVEAVFRWNVEPDAPATDYDRACDVDDYVGIVSVGDGQGLILGDSPDMTTWWALPSGGGILVRWEYAEADTNVAQLMAALPDQDWREEEQTYIVDSGLLYLFDSAFSGNDVLTGMNNDCLTIDLEPGIYDVATSAYQPDDATSLRLYRLLGHGLP